MTAKEFALKKLRDHEECDHKFAGTPVVAVLRAIIQALPDEPTKTEPQVPLWERDIWIRQDGHVYAGDVNWVGADPKDWRKIKVREVRE
jgi:hypothetical protein